MRPLPALVSARIFKCHIPKPLNIPLVQNLLSHSLSFPLISNFSSLLPPNTPRTLLRTRAFTSSIAPLLFFEFLHFQNPNHEFTLKSHRGGEEVNVWWQRGGRVGGAAWHGDTIADEPCNVIGDIQGGINSGEGGEGTRTAAVESLGDMGVHAIRAELERDFTAAKWNKTLREVVSSKMRERGFRRSPEQCKCKWKNLINCYMPLYLKHWTEGIKGDKTSEDDEISKLFFNVLSIHLPKVIVWHVHQLMVIMMVDENSPRYLSCLHYYEVQLQGFSHLLNTSLSMKHLMF
ncbi:uncharacterized protein LOC111240508 [Vigna radiata var. radiata]|uniref:Uncharacterized protein LOC111240508 n=1 Tax=Vigna radiata var. radiata TaxID=3916 RepID=A0A3Q0EUF3_VIGRR|nr:uncharacterized protein LOC111240508 [Vigna radiata var. radiata]